MLFLNIISDKKNKDKKVYCAWITKSRDTTEILESANVDGQPCLYPKEYKTSKSKIVDDAGCYEKFWEVVSAWDLKIVNPDDLHFEWYEKYTEGGKDDPDEGGMECV